MEKTISNFRISTRASANEVEITQYGWPEDECSIILTRETIPLLISLLQEAAAELEEA